MKLACLPSGLPEVFYSIQGEGRNTGMSAVFIRASLCNLHCYWCDTDYTWNWEDTDYRHEKDTDPAYTKFSRDEQTTDLSVATVADLAGDFAARNFIFTGGEPLLQEKAWIELMDLLCQQLQSPHFEIETNGTLMPGSAFVEKIHQINVSPKLKNSLVPKLARWKPDVLRRLAATGKADFKFVVTEDISEVLSIVEDCRLPGDRVFLMPKARSAEDLNRAQTEVASAAKQYGFRYSDRLHLRLFGSRRGV